MRIKGIILFLRRVFAEFSGDDCPQMAAALAYYTVFSLPAVMVIVFSVAAMFWDASDVQRLVNSEMQSILGAEGAQQVQAMLDHLDRSGRKKSGTLMGIAVLVLGASGVMMQLQTALNRAWGVELSIESKRKLLLHMIVKRVVSLAMVLAIAFVLVVSLVVSTLLRALQEQLGGWLPDYLSARTLMVGNTVASVAIFSLFFSAMYKFLPDAKISWRAVWPGGLLAAVLFLLGRGLLSMYLARNDVASAYGAAGSVILIMIWVYYSAMAVLLAAEFTQVYSRRVLKIGWQSLEATEEQPSHGNVSASQSENPQP
ncbi:MAG: serum resistance protein brkB [Pirellulaceae bacterium]|nr:MAG: serum resistance protein brkB [Pirellulaceae bacterium]